MRAAEHERIRVAGELHDGPIQHLASLGYVLDRACRRLRDGDADTRLAHVERARSELGSELAGLRRVMSELRPPVLDEGGLRTAIGDHAARFSREHGVRVEVEADLDGAALAPEIETVVDRVTRESLANVASTRGRSASASVSTHAATRSSCPSTTTGRVLTPRRAPGSCARATSG